MEEQRNKWACIYCTFLNTHDHTVCQICGNQKPAPRSDFIMIIDIIDLNVLWTLKPFMLHVEQHGYAYTRKQIIQVLKIVLQKPSLEFHNLLSGLAGIINLHLNGLNNPIIQDVIHPVIRNLLTVRYGVDVAQTESNFLTVLSLNTQKSTQKPASDSTMKWVDNLECHQIPNHTCFCGDCENIEGLIELPCCKMHLHRTCCKKWFEVNSVCPFCRKVYDNEEDAKSSNDVPQDSAQTTSVPETK